MKRLYILFISVFICLFLWAQESNRNWTYHLSYNSPMGVGDGDDKIFYITDGGLFYYDRNDYSLNTISKVDGLSGSDFSGFDFNPKTKSLVVYYENSMVDVVDENGDVHPFSDIHRKNFAGNKLIYSATCYDNYCYLACGFGIVVIDMVKLEIKDSFIIGEAGNYQPVYDVAVIDNTIYAGTDKGIKYASLDGVNLLDFANWSYIEDENLEQYSYNILEVTGNKRLWAVHKGDGTGNDQIYRQTSRNIWEPVFNFLSTVNDLTIHGDKVIVSTWSVLVYDANTRNEIEKISDYPFKTEGNSANIASAMMDDEGAVWIADKNYGAIKYKQGNYEQLLPTGPNDNNNYAMYCADNKLWVASGGRTVAWNNMWQKANFKGYSNGKWEYYNKINTPSLEYFQDVVDVISKPGSPNHVFVATWGGGVLEFINGEHVETYNENNSTLENISPGDYYVRVGGFDFDKNANLWVTTGLVENNLHKKAPGGNWEKFYLPEIAFNYQIGKVLATSNDQIWIVIPNNKTSALYVMSADGKQKKHLSVVSYFSNGNTSFTTILNDVRDIEEDANGEIWVATSRGVARYARPYEVFDQNPYYASQPGVDKNDGYYHPLLETQVVTNIEIDGGNRKWCGTKNSGLYLISADGTQQIAHYTAENSLLLSNSIVSMAYDGNSGELFVGTEQGLVAFKTDSKKAYDTFEDVYAYPNPVRPNYQGDIHINGMMEDTNVKITTVSGRLVYETTSVGGRATWDGCDLAGNRVHTGIYLVMCSAAEGQESVVTKIAFIR
ncbi:MAG: hypothetical protein JXR50_07460 [Prolixibacteraceae bacterium]|nr:hypothetical protein [Prolixibacteraceae bacterium]MBN2649561.1 hypothetical protein [Prolixibacteraceae bacterium]